MNAAAPRFYVAGGTLHADALSYVPRRADEELYTSVTQGDFSYVLTARQMGKSSLMVRMATRLRAARVAVGVLDLTALGQNLTPEQWYEGLLNRIGQQLDLEDDLEDFWQRHERFGPLQRWIAALREVVLTRCTGQVVLFVDEIDYVRSLPFSTDEFFAAIRECYNRRTQDPTFTRLTFCLLGVATPAELIRDPHTTPFNIGRRITLSDFSATEAAPLAHGFGREPPIRSALLARILDWTGGHPYLTQRLCHAVAEDRRVTGPAGVDRQCAALFLSPRAREQDDNLLFVRERLLRSDADRARLLELYAQVHRRRRVRDDDTNPLISRLHLAGIVRVVEGALRVRNRIYFRVFDREWIQGHLPPRQGTPGGAGRAPAEPPLAEVRPFATAFFFELHDAIETLPGSTSARALLVERALPSLDRLAQEAEDNPALQRELATAYAKVGSVQWNRYFANLGNTAGALESQRKALAMRQALAAKAPTDRGLQRDLAWSHVLVGDTLAAVSDLAGALGHYRQALVLYQALTAVDATHTPLLLEMAVSYERIGDTIGNPRFYNLGDTAGALENYRQELAILTALAAADPTDAPTRHALSIAYEKLGDMAPLSGDGAAALAHYREALALRQALAAAAPANGHFRRDLAVSYRKVGLSLAALHDYTGALEQYGQALAIRQALVETDPLNAGARRDLARIHDDIGQVRVALGDRAGALESLHTSHTLFEALSAADPTNVELRSFAAETRQRLTALQAETSHLDEVQRSTMPQQYGERQDRSRPLLGVPSRVFGREAPLTDPGDIHHLRLEASAERPHRQQPGRERVVGPMPGAVVQHFQGRVHELGLLRQHLADENVRLVWVCGRGGIGKTSLITKLLHELQGRHGTLPQATPPWEVEGIVYVALRHPEFRSPDKLVELICRTLEPHAAEELRAKWQQRSSLADKLEFLFRRSLGGRHYLIVLDNFEDLLDADHGIQEEFADLQHFVERCLEYDHGTRLLVTSRRRLVFSPELEGRLGSRQAELSLDAGLPPADAVALLRALDADGRLEISNASEPTLREVARRCHGIPRTLETLVGTLRQRRTWTLARLLRDETAWAHLTEHPARELYASLSAAERLVTQVLAVYDRPVLAAAVQHLVPGLPVDDLLDVLVSHYVVTYDQGRFSLHPLDRHYAYRQIPDTEADDAKRALHRRAADFFRQLRKPREHWHTIADLDPQLQELHHLIGAELYDQACGLLNGSERSDLLLWGHAASLVHLHSVLVDRVRNRALQAANLDHLGEAYWRLGEAREALRCHEQALTLARQGGNPQREARCLTNIGAVYWSLGQPQEALTYIQQALALFRRLATRDDRWGEATCLGHLGVAHHQLGEAREAITYGKQHLQLARELGDRRGEARALINLGFAYSDLGEVQTTIAYYEQALEVATRSGDRWNAGRCTGNLGLAYAMLGQTQKAIAYFEQALELFRAIGDRRVESDVLGDLAAAMARSGHLERAIRGHREALKIGQDVSDKQVVSKQWLGLAYAYHHLGHLTEARRAYHEGLALAYPLTHYRCAILLSLLCLEADQVLEAQDHGTRGIALCRALLDKTPTLVRPLYSVALAYLGHRQPHEALAAYRRALEVCSAAGVVRDALQDVQLLRRIAPAVAQVDDVTQLLEAARGTSAAKQQDRLPERHR
jgi:tetratricopeptide (TPR) repeat protein